MGTSLYGITGIDIRTFDCFKDDLLDLRRFLNKYDGNIIEIQTVAMFQGVTRYIVIYKAKED